MTRMTRILLVLLSVALLIGCKPPAKDDGEKKEETPTGEKVALDFHIMSKCPFGVKVLQAITPVIEKMGDHIDFNVHYIGREKDGELTSMHGEQEVQGDILELCAKEIGGASPWLEFLKCQNENWRKIPEGWEDCAKTAKIDVAKMKTCFEGDQGKSLLKESFKLSDGKKATGSPTIFLDGEPYRGGRSETSFGRAICAKMKEPKAAYCKDIPAPVKVPVTVVADKRCEGRGCDPQRFLSFVSHTFEGAEIKELDYSDPEGKALFEKSGQQFLPIAVFGPEIEKEEAGYNRLKRRLAKIEGSDSMVYPLGRNWDPTAEVCDDGVDNTGDGKVDCDDDSCKGKKVCREEAKNKLDIFVMSQCPYGVRTVDAMKDVLDAFGKDKKAIDFEINFIGQERDGKLTSMHGQAEVDEDLRQLCAQKLYGKGYKFMDYIFCRNKDYRSADWESCAKGGIQASAIKKCAEGDEGKQLLTASFQKAADLGISGSPSWLLNNKYDMNARNPEAIKKAFCEKNDGVKGCDKALSTKSDAPPAGACGGGPAPAPKKAEPAKAAAAKGAKPEAVKAKAGAAKPAKPE
jgi:glutaredoxin